MRFSGVNNQKKQCKCKKKKTNLYQSISERKSLYKYRFLVKNCIHLIFVYLQIHLIVIPPKPEHWLNFVTIFKIQYLRFIVSTHLIEPWFHCYLLHIQFCGICYQPCQKYQMFMGKIYATSNLICKTNFILNIINFTYSTKIDVHKH